MKHNKIKLISYTIELLLLLLQLQLKLLTITNSYNYYYNYYYFNVKKMLKDEGPLRATSKKLPARHVFRYIIFLVKTVISHEIRSILHSNFFSSNCISLIYIEHLVSILLSIIFTLCGGPDHIIIFTLK